MKKVFVIFTALTMCLCMFAQDANEKYGVGVMPFDEQGKVVFTETINIDKSADVLYMLSKSAITDLFVSAKDVIQVDDKEGHTIILKGVNKISNVTIDFTLKIQTKDNRYRISMYDIVYTAEVYNLPNTIWNAELLTDKECINKKGVCKNIGKGYARRCVIDTKDYIFNQIKDKMLMATTEEDW